MPGKKIAIILLLLAASTLIAFWQVVHCDFIIFDDGTYVTDNSYVQEGISLKGVRWAFSSLHATNWHPLTWLSHMLDVQLFGLNPRWHHLTNLLFHIANSLLLFLVLHRMTKAPWQSAFVAALFALHPLRVESVAWVAERKDVLSTFFWMLTMGAYIFYVERPRLQRYLAVLVFFAFGLMAKPMLVTLPFALLLMDYWPLRRFELIQSAQQVRADVNDAAPTAKRKRKREKQHSVKGAAGTVQITAKMEQMGGPKHKWLWNRLLLWEKIPLFALTVLSSIVTYIAQQQGGAVGSTEAFPLSVRIANAFASYIFYIYKMIWPRDLAVLYPHPGLRPLWQILGAMLLFIAATFMFIWKAKRFPYLASGWLWYVGTLVPVIGLVQVGGQAWADRYTYIPLIGLFILVAWGFPEIVKRWRYRKVVFVASSALGILCLLFFTWTQVGYWRDSITLFNHTLRVTSQNFVILNNRGVAYERLGNYARAIEDYDRAIGINPNYATAYFNRGVALSRLGDFNEAIRSFDKAISINPRDYNAFYNRGMANGMLGNYRPAIADFDQALQFNPEFARAYYFRSIAHDKLGNQSQALNDIKTAARFGSKEAKDFLRSHKIEEQ